MDDTREGASTLSNWSREQGKAFGMRNEKI